MKNKIFGLPDKDYFFDTWPFIILALILFFPLGFILLLRKKDLHRRNVFECGSTAMIIGIIFILIGLFGKFFFTNILIVIDYDMAKFSHWLAIYGVIVLVTGIISRIEAARYRKYINLVVNEEYDNIDEISNIMHHSNKKVEHDLNKMIDKRYFEQYEMSKDKKHIKKKYIKYDEEVEDYGKLDGMSFYPSVNRIIATNLMNSEKKQSGNIKKCQNCGANNRLINNRGKCKYCNSDLSNKR